MFKLDDGAIVDRADDAFQNDGDEGDDSPGEVLWEAIRTELARQIKDAGGPDDSLEEQLRALLASHHKLAELRESPIAKALAKAPVVRLSEAERVELEAIEREYIDNPSKSLISTEVTSFGILKRAREENDTLRMDRDALEAFRRAEVVKRECAEKALAEVQRERDEARAMARHHANETIAERGAKSRYTVNVDTSEAQTKLETLLASAREYEATLDRALAKTQALASCSDPPSIGIGDPPPKPPPPPPSVAVERNDDEWRAALLDAFGVLNSASATSKARHDASQVLVLAPAHILREFRGP